jgi:hypothetical protein
MAAPGARRSKYDTVAPDASRIFRFDARQKWSPWHCLGLDRSMALRTVLRDALHQAATNALLHFGRENRVSLLRVNGIDDFRVHRRRIRRGPRLGGSHAG